MLTISFVLTRVNDTDSGVVVKRPTNAVTIISCPTARNGPIQSCAISLECINIRINNAGDLPSSSFQRLRNRIGVESAEQGVSVGRDVLHVENGEDA